MPELGRFGNTFAHLAEKYPLFGIVESLSALDGQGARRPFFRFIRMAQKNGRQHQGTCRCRLRGKGN
ncbi:hypothetical protein WCP94_004439 [Bilophila wadsworthia]